MSLHPSTHPLDDPLSVVVGHSEGPTLFNHCKLDVLMQLPLPGIVIFVHGVNSNGEWYDAAEEGLCEGLNARLRRRDEHLVHTGVEAGQLRPAQYISELTADGFINPDMQPDTFIQTDNSFSPVIRFRWGYKASGEELKAFSGNVYLNEQDYWGGGPFANGCSSVPELWGAGLDDQLFLWVHAQHLNPTPDRQVYRCPPRPYMVLAAYRLAKLVESIRRRQADVPITIVCHSQGNMVGICAAFLGDTLAPVTDAAGHGGRCVADSYVLCNPPYSLLESNFAEDWAQGREPDPQGRVGRQTFQARAQTLAAFFDIVRGRAALQQEAGRIDRRMANACHGFDARQDRARHGLDGSTQGRVTLYCCPHDQVISATTVQGIGWRGMSLQEIRATRGEGVFTQRVFARGFTVGERPGADAPAVYDFWRDQYNRPQPGSPDFWQPRSPVAQYSIRKGVDANGTLAGKAMTFMLAPLLGLGLGVARPRINALPPRDWRIPLQAPPLQEPFLPESVRWGVRDRVFDEATDPPAEARDPQRRREEGDPYAQAPGTPKGSRDTEAELRYEHHAVLRMQARREGLYQADKKVTAEDQPSSADERYKQWRAQKLKDMLAPQVDVHATDHSTILTNPKHARLALAYDVAIGVCDIRPEDMTEFRIAADWRFLDGLKKNNPSKRFLEYFIEGFFNKQSVFGWANASDSEATMPPKVVNERTHVPPQRLPGE